MANKDRVFIFDTTMRDGEQSPGASMSLEEKIQISRVFDELGIDIIEAGFPIASPGDFEAVTEVSKILKKSIPAGLSRHTKIQKNKCSYDSLDLFPPVGSGQFVTLSGHFLLCPPQGRLNGQKACPRALGDLGHSWAGPGQL